MAAKSYVVTAACALVYHGENTATLIRKGGAVPADADAEQLKVLVERGIVEEREFVGGLSSDPDAPPPFAVPEEPKKAPAKQAEAKKADDKQE